MMYFCSGQPMHFCCGVDSFAEQCRELAKPVGGQLKQTLEEMAKVWDDLARREDKRGEPRAE
jgi:hypothetical protein